MKHLIIMFIPALCLIGCVSSNGVTGENQYAEINAQGRECYAIITVQLDSMTAEYDGNLVVVGRDSVHWQDPGTQQVRSAATSDLRRVRFLNRGLGVAEGSAVGVVPGLAVILASPPSRSGGGSLNVMKVAGVISAVGGAFVGAITGALIGHKIDYEFPAR